MIRIVSSKDRLTLRVALSISVLIAVVIPVCYLLFSYQYLRGVLDAQSELSANAVSGVVRSNPTMWRFEEVRLTELLDRASSDSAAEARRIFDVNGEAIARNNVIVSAPRITRNRNIYDAGSVVAHIEVSRPLEPLLRMAALLACFSSAFAVGVFYLFRTLPAQAVAQANLALEESEEKYRSLYETMQEGVALHQVSRNIDGSIASIQVVDANPAFAAMFAGDTGSVIGSDSCLLFGDLFRTSLVELQQVLEQKKSFSLELSLPNSDRLYSLRAFSPHQGLIATLIDDITERTAREREQLKIDKLESLGLLAGGIAHDFNNILTGIMGNISFAQVFLDATHRSYKPLLEAEKASVRATELAHQLLTFARGGEPIKKVVSIQQLVDESVSLVLHGSNVRGAVHIPDSIHAIEADEGQISQVFHNIIINATQAMPGGGTLTIAAHNETLPDNNPLALAPGTYICLSFTDQGCGIADTDLKRIFDPYFTTKSAGNGLGLASVHSIVTRHGGQIGISSVAGQGTTFTIHLPSLGAPFSRDLIDTARQSSAEHPGGSILVMDDEKMIRDMTTEMLEYLGYQVTTCEDGAQALLQYRSAWEAGNPFSAVIMDLTIPGGMGGKETAQQILAINPEACLIVSSGYSNDPIMSDYSSYGFKGAVAKPYKLTEFGQLLGSLLVAQS